MRVSTIYPEARDFGWCVPTSANPCTSSSCITQCTSDADCPQDANGWTCGAPAKNGTGTSILRLCKPKLGTLDAPFCDMR